MTTPRKTPNPWDEVMNPDLVLNQSRARTWADGYKCGHSDAEMDARDQIDTLLEDTAYLKRQTSNLIEKNDNQVKIIKGLTDTADWQKSIIESHERAYARQRDQNDRLKAEIADEKRIVRLFAEDKRLLADEVKRLTRDNSSRGGKILGLQANIRELEARPTYDDGVTEGERRLHGLGEVGYNSGFIKGREDGNKEMYDDGLRDGIDNAVTEMVTHMQSMGGTAKFLTDHQHKRLKGVLNTVRTHAAELDDEINGLDGTADMLENVLIDIECPPR